MTEDRLEGPGAGLRLWRDAPSWGALRTAAVSALRCADAASGAALLDEACGALKREGFQAVVGPMEGDSWGAYRYVVESDGSPPFLLEPANPPEPVAAFAAAGFAPIEAYVSARVDLHDLQAAAPAAPPGIRLASFDPAHAEAALTRIHALSLEAFAAAPFYRPIARDRFLALYTPILSRLDPDLVLLAEDDAGDDAGGLAGFLFGLPDLGASGPKAAILKTYASRRRGLGSFLARAFHARAAGKGYAAAIHALMHAANRSASHSRALGGSIFRRYALFGRRL